ncbi:trypsin-like peptidase domain-containing protein [Streptomyces sp. SAI-126]|uniref:S1C family serine protease n=1 Tax=Streptomyces sp. SAI-126 TaxID=3377732 RepID=UPI003C7D46B6
MASGPGGDYSLAAPSGDFVSARPEPAAADRTDPAHDPGSSSTPPYGVPGPWAPAPPVQHPANASAQGPATASAQGPVTPSVQGPVTARAQGSAVPSAQGQATGSAQGLATPAEQSPAAHSVQGPAIPSAQGPATASVQGQATASAQGPMVPSAQGQATASAQGPMIPSAQDPATTPAQSPPTPPPPPGPPNSTPPVYDPPKPAVSPVSDGSQDTVIGQTPAPHGTSASPAPPDTPTPPPPPSPAPPPSPDQLSPTGAPGTPAPTAGSPSDAPPAPHTPPTPTPWQNYDPWAPTPLQQTGAAVGAEGRRRGRVRRGLFVGALVLALVAGGVGGVLGAYLERNGVGGDVVKLPQAGRESNERAPDSVAGIAARALPGVVTLHVSGAAESGTGTGFVLDDRGHILTNNHVVEPAGADGEISVTFHSGDTAKATVVGRDSGYDLAVVKVSGVGGLRPMPLGNSDNVQVGDPVVAIGAPFDLEGTVTSGIISAKERPITAGGGSGDGSDVSYVDALQTDAPINPGNSGGPLLDSRARVIGINSAIRSADDGSGSESGQAGSIGLGFAIPVNQAKRVAEELINTGRATHPVIGITLDMDYTGDGARVGTKSADGGPAVTEGGPGDRAGLRAGDVITEVDGRRVHSGDELIVKTRAHRPGDRLELTLKRDGRERTVSLVLGSSDGG